MTNKGRLKFKKLYIILTSDDEQETDYICGEIFFKKTKAEKKYKESIEEAKHYWDNGMDSCPAKYELIEVDYQNCKVIKKDKFELFGGK